eukprot:360774-Chlamydomonas_euryale.AAC.9
MSARPPAAPPATAAMRGPACTLLNSRSMRSSAVSSAPSCAASACCSRRCPDLSMAAFFSRTASRHSQEGQPNGQTRAPQPSLGWSSSEPGAAPP